MSEKHTRKNYHNPFTRNNEGTRIEIGWDNGKKCMYEGTDEQFWSRKICNADVRNRKVQRRCTKKTNEQ